MHHSLVCPACGKTQFFEFGDTEKVCEYEGCAGNVIKIVYDEALLRQVVSDLQAEVKRLQPLIRQTGRKPPKIQKVNNGWVAVPQII